VDPSRERNSLSEIQFSSSIHKIVK